MRECTTPSQILDAAMKQAAEAKYSRNDDEWLEYLRSECAKALAQHFQRAVNIDRSIKSLSRSEMHSAAEAVTARWIVLVSERIRDVTDSTPKQAEYENLLMGG